jgi:hypothetical protein
MILEIFTMAKSRRILPPLVEEEKGGAEISLQACFTIELYQGHFYFFMSVDTCASVGTEGLTDEISEALSN